MTLVRWWEEHGRSSPSSAELCFNAPRQGGSYNLNRTTREEALADLRRRFPGAELRRSRWALVDDEQEERDELDGAAGRD